LPPLCVTPVKWKPGPSISANSGALVLSRRRWIREVEGGNDAEDEDDEDDEDEDEMDELDRLRKWDGMGRPALGRSGRRSRATDAWTSSDADNELPDAVDPPDKGGR
jgi:hypothetical protein